MIDILDTIHSKYVPSKITLDESGEQTTEFLDLIFFGGDQLTEELARNAKHARGDADSSFGRLEGVKQSGRLACNLFSLSGMSFG